MSNFICQTVRLTGAAGPVAITSIVNISFSHYITISPTFNKNFPQAKNPDENSSAIQIYWIGELVIGD